MEYLVYILQSTNSSRYYIGYTKDLNDRLVRHNSNRERSTKNRGPWKVVFVKKFKTKSDAMRYEYYLKRLKNKDYLSKIIQGFKWGGSSAWIE